MSVTSMGIGVGDVNAKSNVLKKARNLVGLLALLVFIGFIAEADSSSETGINEPPIDVVKKIPPAKKWYAGATTGFGLGGGLNTRPLYDYYNSMGYSLSVNSSSGNFVADLYTDMITALFNGDLWVGEVKVYTANRMRDYMDVEFGYSRSGQTISDYEWQSSGNTVSSKRELTAHALYATALLRPPEGYGHFLYLKAGGHLSALQVSKSVTGNAPNLDIIAAGDRLPDDGTSTGIGTLVGIGADFRTGNFGAIRMELNRSDRVGGTDFEKITFNIGYQVNY